MYSWVTNTQYIYPTPLDWKKSFHVTVTTVKVSNRKPPSLVGRMRRKLNFLGSGPVTGKRTGRKKGVALCSSCGRSHKSTWICSTLLQLRAWHDLWMDFVFVRWLDISVKLILQSIMKLCSSWFDVDKLSYNYWLFNKDS